VSSRVIHQHAEGVSLWEKWALRAVLGWRVRTHALHRKFVFGIQLSTQRVSNDVMGNGE
jgi:hypothetical protein